MNWRFWEKKEIEEKKEPRVLIVPNINRLQVYERWTNYVNAGNESASYTEQFLLWDYLESLFPELKADSNWELDFSNATTIKIKEML